MERKIFNYCERALDPAFWAEPLNALTNLAFFAAFFLAIKLWLREGRSDWLGLWLAVLIGAIGVGSFLFHTFATRWAALTDVIPIALFMLFAVYAMAKRFFRLPVWASLLCVLGFIFALYIARRYGGGYFSGSIGYAPALIMLIGSGVYLALRGRAEDRSAAMSLLLAGLVFGVSLTARSLDRPFCAHTALWNDPLGLHFLWHLLNGVTLHLVARAVILRCR